MEVDDVDVDRSDDRFFQNNVKHQHRQSSSGLFPIPPGLSAGVAEGDAAEGETVSQQLSTAKRDLKQLAADCQIAKDNLKEQTVALEDVEAKMKQLGAKVSADEKAVSQARKKIESVEAQIQKLGFDNDR